MAEPTTPEQPAKKLRKKNADTPTQSDGDNGASANPASKSVISRVKETTANLATEAASAARNAANEGKDRASEALTSISKAVEGAANLVEEQVGPTYGKYARQAADQVAGIAESLQSKDSDDLVEDTRTFVRKQPMIAIGAAVAIGFVLIRLVKIGAGQGDDDRTA